MEFTQSLHTVYLSLGSNMGNRFENLQNAVNAVFEHIGTIVKISSVYETPAMGFSGDAFLNCALCIQTELQPLQLIKIILKIEKTMGRERKASKTYSSRPIDIDVIFIDSLIIHSEKLIVPHPQMHCRNFVLQPLADLNPQLIHPVLHKNSETLLAETTDVNKPQKLSKWLANPLREYPLSNYNYIAIEGNIGAGKTSLAGKLANDFNAKLILERFKDNSFLPKFYDDAARYAFPLEMSFLADRYQQLVEEIAQFDLFKECVISDYDLHKSLIFAQITLTEVEYNLYKRLFGIMQKDLPKPDLYVYLYQNTDRLLQNIKKRGRSYEQGIEADYLQKLNTGYLEFIKSRQSQNIKIIDISEMDFLEKRTDYIKILKEMVF